MCPSQNGEWNLEFGEIFISRVMQRQVHFNHLCDNFAWTASNSTAIKKKYSPLSKHNSML